MDDTSKSSDITLADLLAAFSLATDLGLGQPMSHLLSASADRGPAHRASACVPVDRPALFYVAMLAWVGCVADAPEVAANFGDDIAFLRRQLRRRPRRDGGPCVLPQPRRGRRVARPTGAVDHCPAGHRREPGRPGHPGPLPGPPRSWLRTSASAPTSRLRSASSSPAGTVKGCLVASAAQTSPCRCASSISPMSSRSTTGVAAFRVPCAKRVDVAA